MKLSAPSKPISLAPLILLFLSVAATPSQRKTELIIRNGTIATSEGRYETDIRVRGATIVEIGQRLTAGNTAEDSGG